MSLQAGQWRSISSNGNVIAWCIGPINLFGAVIFVKFWSTDLQNLSALDFDISLSPAITQPSWKLGPN